MRKALWIAGFFFSLFGLTGCNIAPAPDDTSQYNLKAIFPDNPKAQQLALAAEHGRVDVIRRLMKDEGFNPDPVFGRDGTPLVAWPVITHNPEGLRAMLDNGADPNARVPDVRVVTYEDGSVGRYQPDNAVVWAAKQEDPIYLKLLLDHGGDPNTRNSNEESLLFQAYIWHGQWQNVQLLVERGADVNANTGGGDRILSQYTQYADFDRAYWLLEHGADPVGEVMTGFKPPRYPALEEIFWYPSKPVMQAWQRQCQIWLLQHGYQRPPMPEHLRKTRQDFGDPTEERDIPLPDASVLPPLPAPIDRTPKDGS